ncbi:MAG: chromate transporter [Burkholderiaceae bacterium]|nr:chromate transporter [Burkholderiaceae bacterium]
MTPVLSFSPADWLGLLGHFLSLSLLAVGGAITTAPDMHRFLVDQRQWLSDPQFNASIAIAQAAPGPNILFVGLMGWNVGLNAGGLPAAALGMALALAGMLLPTMLLAWQVGRWGHRNRDRRAVRAFKLGMQPVVIALLVATGWLLATGSRYDASHWRLWLVTGVTTLLAWRTRLHLLVMLAAGAALGALGWI